MKLRRVILLWLAIAGCSGERIPVVPDAPVIPPPPASTGAVVWGLVVAESGICLAGATVRVVAGQAQGASETQTTPCDAWAYSGGFMFRNLTPGVAMTLRASVPGYADEQVTVVPTPGWYQAVLITPSPQ